MNSNRKITTLTNGINQSNINSFKLYFSLRDRGLSSSFNDSFLQTSIYSLLGLSLVVLIITLTDDRTFKQNCIIILISFVVITVCTLILFGKLFVYLFNYSKFKYWQQSLTFNITGSENLLTNPELLKYLYWYEYCCLKIKYRTTCSQKTKDEVNSKIINYMKKSEDVVSNFKIYNHWQFENDKFFGYANNAVVGILQRFISIELNKINIQHGGIDSIEITTSKKLIKIEHNDIVD